jgi:hypothetical protein
MPAMRSQIRSALLSIMVALLILCLASAIL